LVLRLRGLSRSLIAHVALAPAELRRIDLRA
jgi:hypothetical protein